MGVAVQTDQDLVRLGQEFYTSRLKATLEPAHTGSFVAINVENGDYFVHEQALGALHAARAHYPERVFYLARIGAETTYRIGNLHPRCLSTADYDGASARTASLVYCTRSESGVMVVGGMITGFPIKSIGQATISHPGTQPRWGGVHSAQT